MTGSEGLCLNYDWMMLFVPVCCRVLISDSVTLNDCSWPPIKTPRFSRTVAVILVSYDVYAVCCVLGLQHPLHDGNAILSETFLPFKERRHVGWLKALTICWLITRCWGGGVRAVGGQCVLVCVSLCTTVGRYGEYLSSQHLKLDSTDQNYPPPGSPPVLFPSGAAKHKRHARCIPSFVLHLFFPS